MTESAALSPAEAAVLLKPNRATGVDVLKVTLLSLIARGLLRLEEREEPGLFHTKKVAYLRLAAEPMPALPPDAAVVIELVRSAQVDGGRLRDVIKRAQKEFSTSCAFYANKYVMPGLLARGLLEERKTLFLRSYHATPAGEAERARIEADLAKARTLPALLRTDPAQAATLALALGGTLLLAAELKPHYQALAEAMRTRSADASSLFLSNVAHTQTGDFSSIDFGSFDFGALDGGLASFDAGFSDAGVSGSSDNSGSN